jgi:hypothetical protein
MGENGANSLLVTLSQSGAYKGLTKHQGMLYAVNRNNNQLVRIDETSGVVTNIATLSSPFLQALASTTP